VIEVKKCIECGRVMEFDDSLLCEHCIIDSEELGRRGRP
jgi:hypothetical protein